MVGWGKKFGGWRGKWAWLLAPLTSNLPNSDELGALPRGMKVGNTASVLQ